MKRISAVLILTLGLLAPAVTTAEASPPAAEPGSRFHAEFHPDPCPDGVFAEDVSVECGYVRVPQDRSRPHGKQIRVAAAYVHATSANPAPDPIVFLDGGPSFGAISPFALDLYFSGSSFAEDHDIVLVDTRGTGFSTPRLGCPELDQAEVDSFYSGPTVNSRASKITTRALKKCRARLVARGIDPAAYDTTESAGDLEALRQALGVRRWNLLAISADGLLGVTYMRLFPGGIRSAIIDSGFGNQALEGLDYDRGRFEQLETVFAGCHANAACRSAYPGIRHKFYRLVRQFNRHPLNLTIRDFEPEPATFPIDGAGLLTDAMGMIYAGSQGDDETIHLLLDVVWFWVNGGVEEDYRAFIGTGPVENSHLDDFYAQGKTMSYLCRDSIGFMTRADRLAAAREIPGFRKRYLDHDYDLANSWYNPVSPAGCRAWDVGVSDPVMHRLVRSRIPTLVLTGEFDGGIPPRMTRPILRGLSYSTYVEMPASDHLQLASYNNASDCARSIADAFLAHPRAQVDTDCVDGLPQFDFTPLSSAARSTLPPARPDLARRTAGASTLR